MPAVTIEITDQQEARLRELAEERGLDTPECASLLLGQVLDAPHISPERDGVEPASGAASNGSDRKPVWLRAVEAGESLPAEERARIPRDGSVNVDHYVYGLPKRA